MNDIDAGVGSFAAHCEGYGMSIPGFDSAQAAYDNAEPDNTDEEADEYGDYEEDPDDARDRAYAYGED